ncbi:hypothetical protein IFM89_018336 [Coptis chinensis]|uniref:Uncharacterized protein n=1 Tax=Coptis chinensis TaxID=261450 RepID=A0A835MEX1_9MAGN|nr:hypothetical protein IFM89_018336 [Coptis chinensis]
MVVCMEVTGGTTKKLLGLTKMIPASTSFVHSATYHLVMEAFGGKDVIPPFFVLFQQCSIKPPDYGPLPQGAPSCCQSAFEPEGILRPFTVQVTRVTAGAAGIYVLVDVWGYRQPTIVLELMGKHALMIYIFAACNLLPLFLHAWILLEET